LWCVLQLNAWTGNGLLPLLEEQLDPALYSSLAAAAAGDGSSSEGAAEQQQHLKARIVGLLYAVANLCSAQEAQKEAVVASRIPVLLLQHLSAGSSSSSSGGVPAAWVQEVRLAAVWCVINMLWSEGDAAAAAAAQAGSAAGAADEASTAAAAAAARVAALKQLGYEDALKSILAQCTGAAAAAEPAVAAAAAASPSAAAGAAGAAGSSRGAGAAAAAGVSVPLPPPLPADVYSQDLCERLQTALEQLGVK
jgi:hypothetical protein